jgi:hypothetical protein
MLPVSDACWHTGCNRQLLPQAFRNGTPLAADLRSERNS